MTVIWVLFIGVINLDVWLVFFGVLDALICLVPSAEVRAKLRYKKLFDYRRKLSVLMSAFPDLNYLRTRLVKGGWNIGFIIENAHVFKFSKTVNKNISEKIVKEKRITDAFRNRVKPKIPNIDIVSFGGYIFYKYDFIAGKNLNKMPLCKIVKNREKLGMQISEFIKDLHGFNPPEISDLVTGYGEGWNHNDLCNNMLVNPKNMKLVGVIDWEYANWGKLETELQNVWMYSSKIRKSKLKEYIKV